MKPKLLKALFGALWLLCFGIAANATTTITIAGDNTVCLYSQTTYSVTPTGGVTYVWSVTTPNTVASSSASTAAILWNAIGTYTVSVNGFLTGTTTLQETGSISVQVFPNPVPLITTDYRVACNGLSTEERDDETHSTKYSILDDSKGCVKVCDSSFVTYHALGDTTGTILWAVTGGAIISGQGTTTLVVQWGAAPTLGSISLTETSTEGCTTTKTICIEIIEKPQAAFCVLPDLTAKTSIDVCLGNPVVFKDLSTAGAGSPIVSWLWNFGDGTGTSVLHPSVSHTYNTPGLFTAYLVVTNACGCKDSFFAEVNVINELGPDIICASVACENDTSHYHTSNTCGSWNWTVVGGTIQSGAGTQDIVVKWDAVGPDGFGYVSLSTGCGLCPGSTTIKIPVVQSNPVITGPTVMCTNKPYQLSIPLWPGTQYNWGVIGTPSAVIAGRNSNVVSLLFTSPGTYTVHISYQNKLRLCGGDLQYTVSVTDPEVITGDTIACKDAPAVHSYSLSGGSSASWTLALPNGTYQTGSGSTYNATFAISGTYTLSAVVAGTCPPDPLKIVVADFPIGVDSISGETTVCTGAPNIYKAGVPISGTHFEWRVVSPGGSYSATLTPPTGDQTTITFNYSGAGQPTAGTVWQVYVKRVSNKPPYCESSESVINVSPIIVNPSVTGPKSVCANSIENYTANYPDADNYSWQIISNNLGSVVTGNFANNMSVLWHNASGTAMIVATVTRCNITVKDTLYPVFINPAPLVAITLPSPICQGQSVTFTATAGAAGYSWTFGDGGTALTSTNTVAHAYSTATGSSPLTAAVTASGVGGSCSPTGSASVLVTVLPAPIASITCPTGNTYCSGTPFTAVLQAINTGSSTGTLSYQWFLNGTLVGTASTYNATTVGSYSVTVTTGSTGCSSSSAFYVIDTVDCSTTSLCVGTPTITGVSQQCGVITATATVSTGGTNYDWKVSPNTPAAVSTSGSSTLSYSATYDEAGYYFVGFSADFPQPGGGMCKVDAAPVRILIPLIPDYRVKWNCPTSGSGYTLTLTDHSGLAGGYATSSISWTVKAGSSSGSVVATGSGSPYSPSLSSGTYWIEAVVIATDGVTPETCSVANVVTMPTAISSASINASYNGSTVTSICEGLPVQFTLSSTPSGVISSGSVVWDYDDGSGNANVYPGQRTFKYSGTFPPDMYNVKAIYTDVVGCSYSSNYWLNVYPNTISGNIAGNTVSCSGTPITLTYSPITTGTSPHTYTWSNGGTSISTSVTTTGGYNVTISDLYQCRFKTLNHYATFVTLTPPQISGLTDYCVGDVVRLSGSIGLDPAYTYSWYRNSSPVASGPYLADIGLPAGTYNYYLDVTYTDPVTSLTCTVSSGVYVVTVHGTPAAPTITGPSVISCVPYMLQLTASHTSGATQYYNWSNAVSGQKDTIYTGGPYRLWYTDQYGCTSHADISVPYSPESYFDWFPSGCYTVCNKQIPLTMYGPPGIFPGWGWLENGSYQSSGAYSVLDPLYINGAGTYQMELNNGLCTNTTDPMNVTVINCDNCPPLLMNGNVMCDPTVPGGYTVVLNTMVSQPNTTMTIGTSIGPAMPFSAFFSSPGMYPISISFTTLSTPPPATVTIQVRYTAGGRECYDEVVLSLPPCTWSAQRQVNQTGATTISAATPTGMMVYPNPAANNVTVGYNFGKESESGKRIVVYDLTGKRVFSQTVQTATGSLNIQLDRLAGAMYIVRMEEDGVIVQTQRLSISH